MATSLSARVNSIVSDGTTGDVKCNSLHVDPSSAGSTLPYAYTEPGHSWFFVDSFHPPTAPEFRVIDQTTRDWYRIQVSNGSLRAILDDDQSTTY